MRHYEAILKVAADHGDVLMQISGDLGSHGYLDQILTLILPVYDPEKHDVQTGFNVLQAYVEKGDYILGQRFLQRMYVLNRPDIRERLHYYAAEFEKLKDAAEPLPPAQDEQVEIGAARFDRPIWAYGLNDPKWLFASELNRDTSVMFVSLANTSPTDADKPVQQKEDDIGRLTRSLPLYLAEAAYFWSDIKPIVIIPVAKDKGPAVYGSEWPVEQIQQLADGVANTVVFGSIEQKDDETLVISLRIWDGMTKQTEEAVSISTSRTNLGRTVLDIEQTLLSKLSPSSVKRSHPAETYYVRPPTAKLMEHYLICLGQSLMMTLVQNEYVGKDHSWGERNMLDYSLSLAVEVDESQVAKIQFLSCLAKAKGYDSAVVNEYKAKALALLADDADNDSTFSRLAPVLFRTFGMDADFRKHTQDLLGNAEPQYREWLEAVQPGKP